MAYDGHLSFDTKLDTSAFASGIGKLGGIAKSGLAVLGVSVAGAATAFAGLTKAALDSTASLEQNVGGIETLFGAGGAKSVEEYAQSVGKSVDQVQDKYNMLMEAQTKAMQDADEAYKTAGMSANDYMETVTGFAAALKQSTKDEMEAAQVGNQAVIDMADNANKMGTSLESIQNAYQGFAKQNYTMLDNLKLGYGGTKEEMGRLLDDAQKLSGQTYDIGNLKDVYTAIHVIQENLGITGTTAKEAASTIEGSMNSAKAAFDNFLNGRGSAEQLADAVATATVNVAKNLGEIVPRLVETLPEVASALGQALSGDASAFIQTGAEILGDIATGIMQALPELANTGLGLITNLVSGVSQALPELLPVAVDAVFQFAQGLVSNLPTLISSGIQIIESIAQGIANSLPSIIENAPRLINDFADAIYGAIPQILAAGIKIIITLGKGIIDSIPTIIANAGEIVQAIINVFTLINLAQLGVNIIKSLGTGLGSAGSFITSILKQIVEMMKHPFDPAGWIAIGKNIISGIATGIKSAASSVVNAATNAVSSAKDAVKTFLGIHSPSRVFRDEVGRNIALGIGDGISRNAKYAEKSAEEIAQAVLTTAQGQLDNKRPLTVEEDLFSRAVQATMPTAQRTGTPARTYGNEGNGPGTGIDYAKLGKAMSEAMNGVNVEMDGKRVGQITAEPVNDRLGDRSRMEERDMI